MVKEVLWITLLLMTLASLPPSFHAMGSLATVSIQPRINKVWGTRETFNINISVTNVTNLYGWQTKLYYDSSIINGTSVREGPFLKSSGETFFNYTINNNYNATHGCIKAFNTLLGEILGVNGTGVLLTITFKTVSLGISPLNLEEVILADISSNTIPHTVMDGAVEVVEVVHDVAIRNVSVSSDVVVDGETVEVYVTAANMGNKTEIFDVTVYWNESLIAKQTVSSLSPQKDVQLTFLWNTSSITPNATCIIKAEASHVPEETNFENNVLVYGPISVVQGVHDIAVIEVRSASQNVYEGETLNVYVTVANRGNYTETFNVTVYLDDFPIGLRTVTNLAGGCTKELTFTWNTEGAGSKTYMVKASAGPVTGETRLADNSLSDGNVTIYPYTAISITITEVFPCDQLGRPISSFQAGTVANFKVTINCTLIGAKNILLTINVQDAGGNTIGVVSFQGPVASGVTTFVLGLPIPTASMAGNARVYANALNDWPHLGGTPYCPEISASFEIRS